MIELFYSNGQKERLCVNICLKARETLLWHVRKGDIAVISFQLGVKLVTSFVSDQDMDICCFRIVVLVLTSPVLCNIVRVRCPE